jgi:hypothetical protein
MAVWDARWLGGEGAHLSQVFLGRRLGDTAREREREKEKESFSH